MRIFPKVHKSMKFAIHKYIVNVVPVTNPTQYAKLDKKCKNQNFIIIGNSDFMYFRAFFALLVSAMRLAQMQSDEGMYTTPPGPRVALMLRVAQRW